MSAMSYRPCKECFGTNSEHSRPSNHGLKFLGLYRKLAPKCPPWAIDHAGSVLARIPSILDHQITVWSFWGLYRKLAPKCPPCAIDHARSVLARIPSILDHQITVEVFGSIPEIGAKMSAMSYRPCRECFGTNSEHSRPSNHGLKFWVYTGNWRQNVRHEL